MQHAVPHDGNAIADRQSFSGVMGDDHAARTAGVQYGGELTAQAEPHLHIQA